MSGPGGGSSVELGLTDLKIQNKINLVVCRIIICLLQKVNHFMGTRNF
jgi:hypothetical protein